MLKLEAEHKVVGGLLATFSKIVPLLYFITTSLCGSIVIDALAANGFTDPPKLQQVFWALVEGSVALNMDHT